MTDPDDGLSPVAKAYRDAAPWLSAVWELTGSVMVGVGVGYVVERRYGVEPWGLLVGGLVGCAVGFYAFIKAVLRLTARKSKSKSKSQTEVKRK